MAPVPGEKMEGNHYRATTLWLLSGLYQTRRVGEGVLTNARFFGSPSPDVHHVRGVAWTFWRHSSSNHHSSSMIVGLFNPHKGSDSTHAKPNGVLLAR